MKGRRFGLLGWLGLVVFVGLLLETVPLIAQAVSPAGGGSVAAAGPLIESPETRLAPPRVSGGRSPVHLTKAEDPTAGARAGSVARLPQRTDPSTIEGFVEGRSREVVEERDARSQTFENPDGTTSRRVSVLPRFFEDGDGSWDPIDLSLNRDARDVVRSGANSFGASFRTGVPGYRLDAGDEFVSFAAEGATPSKPVMDGKSVTYRDAWPGVDLRYSMLETGVKADIVIRRPTSQGSFSFALDGSSVAGRPASRRSERELDISGGLRLSGKLGDEFVMFPPVVSNEAGTTFFPEAGAALDGAGRQVTVSLDQAWLAGLSADSFPIVVDPTTAQLPTGSYWAYKSDGYSCSFPTCAARIGNSRDSNQDKYWRTVWDYELGWMANSTILDADLTWLAPTGSSGATDLAVMHATDWSYPGAVNWSSYATCGPAVVEGALGSCDITGFLANLVAGGHLAASFGLAGGEVAGSYTYKQFTPDLWVTFNRAPRITAVYPDPLVSSVHAQTTPLHAWATDDDGDQVWSYYNWNDGVSTYPVCLVGPGAVPLFNACTSPLMQWNRSYQVSACTDDGYSGPQCWPARTVWAVNSTPSPATSLSSPIPNFVSGVSNPTLSVTSSTDADGDAVYYEFSVATGTDGLTGRVLQSNGQSGPSWTPAQGALADGVFHWTARACDQFGFCTAWAQPRAIRVARRLGMVPSNPYDQAGPVAVNLSNGNAVVTAAGPSYSSLGGPMGVSFTYNSQSTSAQGLVGTFATDRNGNGTRDGNEAVQVTRVDPAVGFNWGAPGVGPAPGVVDPKRFTGRWTGNFRNTTIAAMNVRLRVAPPSADTSNPMKLNFGGVDYAWNAQSAAVNIGAGGSSPVVIDFGYGSGSSGLRLEMDCVTAGLPGCSAGAPWVEVPPQFLAPADEILPGAWAGTGVGLGTAEFTRLAPSDLQVSVFDSSGAPHVWLSTGSGWRPPSDEDGSLAQLADGTWELTSGDGSSYLFDSTGLLTSVTSGVDAKNPAVTRYFYGPYASGKGNRLRMISDVFGRQIHLVYGNNGSANAAPPSGPPSTVYPLSSTSFTCPSSSAAPAGMLCQVRYEGFRRTPSASVPVTDLTYSNGNLARIENPGVAGPSTIRPTVDFGYDPGGSGKLVSVRDVLTNDLIAAPASGYNATGGDQLWQIGYSGEKVSSVTAPLPAAGATRPQRTYSIGASSSTVAVLGSVNASGWTRQVDFDAAGRTTADRDQGSVAVEQQWTGPFDVNPDTLAPRDLVLRTIDAHNPSGAGYATTIFDAADRPVESYGPGSQSELGSTYTSPTAPKTTTAYDEGFVGLAARWYGTPALGGAAKLYSTFDGDESWGGGSVTNSGPFPGVTVPTNGWSGSLTGHIVGAGQPVGARSDEGRLYVNDIEVGDTWGGTYRSAVGADSPVGYWRLGETTGSEAADESKTVPGLYSSVTLNQSGALGSGDAADPDAAAKFNGSSSKVTLAKPAWMSAHPLDLAGDMAVEALVKASNTTGFQTIAARTGADLAADSVYYLLVAPGGWLHWGQSNGSGGINWLQAASGQISANTWTHVAATRVNGVVRLYVNDANVATSATWSPPPSRPTVDTLIGRRVDGMAFNGTIDEVAIYATGLSAARVNVHNAARAGASVELSTAGAYEHVIRSDSPSAWWRLDDANRTVAADSSTEGSAAGTTTTGPHGVRPTPAGAVGADGVAGSAMAMSGNNTYDVPWGLVGGSSQSIETWFKASTPGGILHYGNPAGGDHVPLAYIGTDGKLRAGFWPMPQIEHTAAGGTMADSQWHHLVLSNAGGSVSVYLDGKLIGVQNGAPNHLTMTEFYFGTADVSGWPAAPCQCFSYPTGALDDTALYSYPLSAAQVKAHFEAMGLRNLVSGKEYRVRVDFADRAGNAALSVRQGSPGSSTVIPVGQMKPKYGLVTSVTDPDGKLTRSEYQYPELGLKTAEVVDPLGLNLRTEYTFESASSTGNYYRRPKTRKLPALVGTSTTPTTYTHRSEGSATGVATIPSSCPGGGQSGVHQGGALWKRTNVDPDGSGSAAAIVEESIYFGDGLLAASRRGSESWTCYTYDERGRPLSTVYPAFGAQTATRTVAFAYSVSGDVRRSTVGDSVGTISTTTDWLGRTTSTVDVWGVTTTTAYDTAGRPMTSTVTGVTPAPPVMETTYDTNGRVATIKSGGSVLAQPTYNLATGAVTSVSYPSGAGNAGNGSSGTLGFDTRGRANSVSWSGPGSTLLTSNGVTRSLGGRITDQTIDGTDQSAGADAFGYDGAGRLTAFRSSGGLAEYVMGTQAAGCAGVGAIASGKNSNRTDRKLNGAVVASSCYDRADRLVSTTEAGLTGTISYDAHGNMIAIVGETRTYDMADRHLRTTRGSGTALNQVDYTRDALDRIVRRVETINGAVTSTVKYGFTGAGDSQALVLTDTGNNVAERTVGLPGGVNVTYRTGGQVWSYPTIHGDVAAIANASGVKQGSTTVWDPWGSLVSGTLPDNSAANWDYGWHGQQSRPLDHSSGLVATIEMGARQYLPQLGRFIEVDPIEGGTPNDYIYPTDPVNSSDVAGEGGPCSVGSEEQRLSCRRHDRRFRGFRRLSKAQQIDYVMERMMACDECGQRRKSGGRWNPELVKAYLSLLKALVDLGRGTRSFGPPTPPIPNPCLANPHLCGEVDSNVQN